MKADRDTIVRYLDTLLDTAAITDASCNGLQVEGGAAVGRIGLGVDASLALYRTAAAAGCSMLIVHHGLIWNGITAITGPVLRQVQFLIDHGISLYASHLPLDMHPACGNNAVLAKMMHLRGVRPFGLYHGTSIGWSGRLARPLSTDALARLLGRALGVVPVSLPFGRKFNRTVAVLSGRGTAFAAEAAAAGIDCFVTGEPVHEHHHQALESGLNVIYCSHYHSEKTGVQALGGLLKKKFRVPIEFLDVPTLV